uniref:Uncharacterized protein n=1 Tax=Vespula pensylvanica TaxID=30213 RepID=A0A834PDP0_VESPE|nr:hypothetical protein H0235_000249 [Vespula pensylvanica]
MDQVCGSRGYGTTRSAEFRGGTEREKDGEEEEEGGGRGGGEEERDDVPRLCNQQPPIVWRPTTLWGLQRAAAVAVAAFAAANATIRACTRRLPRGQVVTKSNSGGE